MPESSALRPVPKGESDGNAPPARRNGFAISHGREPVTADIVARVEAEDDAAAADITARGSGARPGAPRFAG